jgi:RHS repeat-associated protein
LFCCWKVGVGANRYQYNGKEFTEEVGLLDYGARYYDSAIARWTAVDPLADQYAPWSTYNYVLGNPLIYIDPDGMQVDDTYSVDREGYITHVDDKKHYDVNGNEVDVIVAGELKYDDDGNIQNKATQEVQKGTLRKSGNDVTVNGEEGGSLNFGENDSQAREVFEFLADNTDVEWSIFKTSQEFFGNKTSVNTSHDHESEQIGATLANAQAKDLIYLDHSHPNERGFEARDRSNP